MTLSRARQLRRDSTDAEQTLWRALRAKHFAGLKFRRQQPIGPYIVDFVSFQAALVIELDGGQHDEQAERDETRTLYLNSRGLQVLRFWNNEILPNPDAALAGCGRKGSGTRWEMLGNRKDHRNGSFAGADRGFWPLRAGC